MDELEEVEVWECVGGPHQDLPACESGREHFYLDQLDMVFVDE